MLTKLMIRNFNLFDEVQNELGDASRTAEEVVSHRYGMAGASANVTIEIEADIPELASDQIVRILIENSQTLKLSDHGFEME